MLAKATDAPVFDVNQLYTPTDDCDFNNYIPPAMYSDTQEDIEKSFQEPPAAITPPQKGKKLRRKG